MASEDPKMSK